MLMDNRRYKRVSKLLSFILRHGPQEYGVQLDARGYADVAEVLAALRTGYPDISAEDVLEIVRVDDKGRYEVAGGRIRARYGHSVEVASPSATVHPPDILYHGTAARNTGLILRQGLLAMNRRMVHLSPTREEALAVGSRHSAHVVLLIIRAREASEAGVSFYLESRTYLAKSIPPEFISVSSPAAK
jgi:putative RNA 2'-phosphotransferase